MFGNISGTLGNIVSSLHIDGLMQSSLAQTFATPDAKRQFIALLLATAAHVENKPQFNFDLEMNDLWLRLGNLKDSQGPQSVNSISSIMNASSNLINNIGQSLEAISRNIK